MAVDNSGGATDGDIYVGQARAGSEEKGLVDIFGEDGSFLGQLTESSEGEFHEPCGVAVVHPETSTSVTSPATSTNSPIQR